ncbi:MAG: methylenetetrahydrofolate reductase C-terminal domain-containing protein [Methanotrichaceae archaeon]|nr:methylenetetrahydrofolate reductase C-terminal domain-containing protein [Methanotrichaceae archaeon]
MNHGKLALILLLILFAIQVPLNGEAAFPSNTANGSELNQTIKLEDSNFRPDPDGFSFPNYGNELGIVGLTPMEMLRMFGDKVIASTAGGNIILTPQAKRWMNIANKAMAYGHCEGMAVLSDLIYYNKTDPMDFGNRTTIDLSIQNERLQREIAYWWTTQVTKPGGFQKVSESPNAVLDTLAQAFKDGRKANEWWVMGLYQPDRSEGHAVTPFAVENLTNGTARIWIYDNNYPTLQRYVEIDRNANTWKYNASINPNEPSVLYAGNASTESLEVVSVSSRLEPQECEFCVDGARGKGALSQKHAQIWSRGIDRVLITDKLGRRIGITDSGISVNEIPDAERLDLRFDSEEFQVYNIPDGLDFSTKFSGSQNRVQGYPIETELWIIGPGYDVGMQNLGSQGLAELTWSSEDIARLTWIASDFDNAMIGNLSLGMGNTEFEVQNAPKTGILEMNGETDILIVTNYQLGQPIQVHLEMDAIDDNGEYRLEDSVSMKPYDIIYFPDACKGVICNKNQHCEGGTCVENPDQCENVMCAENQHCVKGKCYSNYDNPSSGIANPSSGPIIDPCAGVVCGECEECRDGECVWVCPMPSSDPCAGVVCGKCETCQDGECIWICPDAALLEAS